VHSVNEWFENLEIDTWKTTKYTDCKEKSVNKEKKSHIWWKAIPDELKSLFCYLIQHRNDSKYSFT
jgi:hypothetical protein